MSATNTTFWKQWSTNSGNNPNPNPKLPGRVIMNSFQSNKSQSFSSDQQRQPSKQRTSSVSSMTSTPTKHANKPTANHHKNQHKRNNSSSFEVFTASCDDAWDSKIEDCLQTEPNNVNTFSTNYSNQLNSDSIINNSSLLIRETVINLCHLWWFDVQSNVFLMFASMFELSIGWLIFNICRINCLSFRWIHFLLFL